MSNSKICKKCFKKQNVTEFVHDKSMPDGFKNTCLTCSRAYNAKYRAEHLALERARDRKRYRDHGK
jgi:hypothetical protein